MQLVYKNISVILFAQEVLLWAIHVSMTKFQAAGCTLGLNSRNPRNPGWLAGTSVLWMGNVKLVLLRFAKKTRTLLEISEKGGKHVLKQA